MHSNGRNITAVITGFVVLLAFLAYYEFPFSESAVGRMIGGTLSIILRAISYAWISKIAKSQGRKHLGYSIIGIIFPAITLIVIGLLGNRTIKPA